MPEDTVKQVIVMRKDLQMRKGKMIAQGAHASIAFLTNKIRGNILEQFDPHEYVLEDDVVLSAAEKEWVEGLFTKICVGVNSDEELVGIHQEALDAGLVSHLITDAGLTEFKDKDGNPIPTRTCCAIGPDYVSKIDPITKGLPLL